jgi:hypothetical protein
MNTQDQEFIGRHVWNLCFKACPEDLREQSGIVVDILEDGRGAVVDMEKFVILLRAEEAVFNAHLPLRASDKVVAEVFPRQLAKVRATRPTHATVPLSAEALWTWRSVWDQFCGLDIMI